MNMYSFVDELEGKLELSIDTSIVVCFDIGTHASGYAYSIKSDEEIFLNVNWNNDHVKTLTCLLIENLAKCQEYLKNPSLIYSIKIEDLESVFMFGHNAKTKYLELNCENRANNIYYFEYFKMNLYDENIKVQDMKITTQDGRKSLKAEMIFGLSILYLKKHVTDRLKLSGYNLNDFKNIQWILTVPAIWSPKSKQIMRKSAQLAGLCDSNDNKLQLRLALEPEVAGLACVIESNNKSNYIFKKKDLEYLLIDAGGGTIDIAAHKIIDADKNLIKEIHFPTGLNKGSSYINQLFEKLLYDIFGEANCKNIKNDVNTASSWDNLIDMFETKKVMYKSNKMLIGPLGYEMVKILGGKELMEKSIQTYLNQHLNNSIKISNGFLELNEYAVQNLLFNPIITPIIDHVKELLDLPHLQKIDYIILVGGFANSQVLQNQLKNLINKFNNKIQLIVPNNPASCVVRGGCSYGKYKHLIRARKSRYTIGLAVSSHDINSYPERKPVMNDFNEEVINNVFKCVIKEGEEIPANEIRKISLGRGWKENTSHFPILMSTNPNVKYSNDKSVKELGTIMISNPDLSDMTLEESKKSKYKIKFKFGDTEIFARVKSELNGESKSITLDFDTMQL